MRWPKFRARQTTELESALSDVASMRQEVEVMRAQISGYEQNFLDIKSSPSGWPYHLDHPHNFWITMSPRRLPGRQFSVESLRSWSRNFDPLRSVIEYLKAEAASVPVKFVARAGIDEKECAAHIELMEAFCSDDGPLGMDNTRRTFESRMLDDVLVVGNYAVWNQLSRGGQVLACDTLDAATIKPKVDTRGWPDKTVPYEQWVIGVFVMGFKQGELRYDGLFPRTDTPYFDSAVEWAVSRITAGLKLDEWNLGWLTEGNVRTGDTISLPSEWTPDQVMTFTDWWNASSATAGGRQKTSFLPAGSTKLNDHSRKDQDFAEYETQVIRRLCSLFGVMPASIGYVGEQYKVTQGDSMDQSRRVGLGRLLALRKEFYDDLCRRLGCPDIECLNVEDDLGEHAKEVEAGTKACGGAFMTIDEVRARNGLPPLPNGHGGDIHAPQAAKAAPDDPEPNAEPGTDPVERAEQGTGHWVTIRGQKVFILDVDAMGAAAYDYHALYGGSTFSARDGNMAGKDLWSVAYKDQSETTTPEEFDAEWLANYIQRHKKLVMAPGHAVGTWHDEESGIVWVDVVKLVEDEKEAEDFGVAQNQIAMFHLGRFETRNLGGTGL